jgi:Fe-S oxidoreductase
VTALSMPDPRAALGDERLHRVLDLCLECKACKRECPLGIDMATLKSEFLASYQEIHGVPLRSRLFGSIRTVNRLGSALAPVSNLAASSRPARRLLERLLGLSAARPLPRFQHQNLLRWHRRHRSPQPGLPPNGELVFLADCFTTFTEPQVGIAAIELLERAGWTVRLEAGGCCGRASLSKGLVDRARRQAGRLVARLADDVAQGRPIVAVEPSCLFTLRDDYPALLAQDSAARAVASATRQPEELVLDALAAGHLRLRTAGPPDGIVFHGHCHQKAVAGTAATVGLLSSLPDCPVTELDAGCCGMAGSFGYEAEHYDLSMRIAELRLFPQVRAQPAGTLITATGTSCRQQLSHGTGRRPAHPLQIVRSLLELPAGFLMVLTRRQASNDAELLMLRHENAVPRRQADRVRYQPADRLWFAALSRLVPRRLLRYSRPTEPLAEGCGSVVRPVPRVHCPHYTQLHTSGSTFFIQANSASISGSDGRRHLPASNRSSTSITPWLISANTNVSPARCASTKGASEAAPNIRKMRDSFIPRHSSRTILIPRRLPVQAGMP